MNKNKDFFPNNLLFKNYPNAITYSIGRIKVYEQFSGHFEGIFIDCKMNLEPFFLVFKSISIQLI